MKVKISNIKTGKIYIAGAEQECHDLTDRSLFQEVERSLEVITMGCMIGEPLPEFITVCAWCGLVKVGERWLKLILPKDARVSHGPCPDCLEKHFPEKISGK